MSFGRAVAEGQERIPLIPGILRPREQLPPHRVVTLAFLSESLWADLISEQIAGSLLAETQGSVVLVRFQDNGTQAGQIPPAHLPISLNGEFHMPAWVGEP